VSVPDNVRAFVLACPPSPDRDRTLAFLDTCEDWLEGPDGHITASAVVLDATAERTLLIYHRKLERWLQPGGHVEATDADLVAAALREATEETGITGLIVDPDPVHLDVHWVGTHYHYDVRFIVRTPQGAEPSVNADVDQFLWVTADELEGVGTDESVVGLVAAALDRVRRPMTS
jgi:8-oxo-dGTP pyrophosphatase MutT (NUDIX family)